MVYDKMIIKWKISGSPIFNEAKWTVITFKANDKLTTTSRERERPVVKLRRVLEFYVHILDTLENVSM